MNEVSFPFLVTSIHIFKYRVLISFSQFLEAEAEGGDKLTPRAASKPVRPLRLAVSNSSGPPPLGKGPEA